MAASSQLLTSSGWTIITDLSCGLESKPFKAEHNNYNTDKITWHPVINLQSHICFIYNVLVTLSLFVLETFLNAHPPLNVKWFSPPARSNRCRAKLFTDSEWRRRQDAKKSRNKKRKEKKLRREKEV